MAAPETSPYTLSEIQHYRVLVEQGNTFFHAARVALGHDTTKAPSHLETAAANDFLLWLDKGELAAGAITTNQVRKRLRVKDQFALNSEVDVPAHDPVNHPRHYTQYKGLQIIDLTEQMNFNLGNAVKYIARAGFKDATKTLEDLEKAVWYTQREIERLKLLADDPNDK